MKRLSIFIVIVLSSITQVFSQDTILVELNLNNIKTEYCTLKFKLRKDTRKSDILKIKLDLSKANISDKYLFPVSIPGTYQNRHYSIYNRKAKSIDFNNEQINLKKRGDGFVISSKNINQLEYESIESKAPRGLFQPEDSYFSDSGILLNWNVLLGYFKETNNVYKIKVIKPHNFLGVTAMTKRSINDTTDVFIASDYTELIHSPLMYSEPDTTSFYSEKCLVKIACESSLKNFNATIIKKQIKPIFNKILAESNYHPKEYSILVMGNDCKLSYSLIALEHPNSTVLCLPQNFKDSSVVASIIAHEFWHALYAPLNIESTTIKSMDYQKPICDEHLWFYEGCTEYLSQKKCVQAGIMDTTKFIRDLYYECKFMDNINLAKLSKNVYSRKGQKYYGNVYSKGSLVAFLLDLELLSKSNYKCSLSDLMNKMQKYQEQHGAFESKELISILSKLSNVNLSDFFNKYVNSEEKIDFAKELPKINYKYETQQLSDSLFYTYSINSIRHNYQKKDTVLFSVKKSDINKQLGIRKVNIYKIDNKELDEQSASKLFFPKKEYLELTIIEKGKEKNVKVKATKKNRERTKRIFKQLSNETTLSKAYWGR